MRKIFKLFTIIVIFSVLLIGCGSKTDNINDLDSPTEEFSYDDLYSIGLFDSVETSNQYQETVSLVDEIQEKQEVVQNDSSAVLQVTQQDGVSEVWIPSSGKKYHKNMDCSNMRSPEKVPLSEAVGLGFEPCKRCFK